MRWVLALVVSAVGAWCGSWAVVPGMDFFERHLLGRYITPRGSVKNGAWLTRFDLARAETPAVVRAYIARIGIAANQAEEALYWNAVADDQGQALHSGRDYEIRFSGRPPVARDGFWSLTVYNEAYLLVGNQAGRFALGDRSPLRANSDGSFSILLSRAEHPENPNWLPLPKKGQFTLTLRMYIPDEAFLRNANTYRMPQILRRND